MDAKGRGVPACPKCARALPHHLIENDDVQVPYRHCDASDRCDFRTCLVCHIVMHRVTGHYFRKLDVATEA